MKKQQIQGYLLGFGSNIAPFENIANLIAQLLHRFHTLHISRIVHIPPVGMNSQHYFLNAVAFVETTVSRTELKQYCNQIETALGRDREDPNSKFKDRPADIDILAAMSLPEERKRTARELTDEYFLYPLIDELIAFLTATAPPTTLQAGVSLQLDNLTFGETATTIHWNGNASQKRVV